MPINPNQISNDIKKSIYIANNFQSNSPPTPTESPPVSAHLTLLSSNCNMNLGDTATSDKNNLTTNPSYELMRCSGCKNYIEDKYVLSLMNSYWHESCLTCSYCGQYLQNTCYHKNMQLYCKDDYIKLYGSKCNSCNKLLHSNELVMRTTFGKVFHLNCFKCSVCEQHLKKGDEYLINEENIYCKYDYELLKLRNNNGKMMSCVPKQETNTLLSLNDNDITNIDLNHHHSIHSNQLINNSNSSFNSNQSDEDDSLDEDGDNRRTSKRPRTILTSSQRRKFRDAFGISQKPCRKVREQLASETGLSVRVVQVWFQNERAKMKKLQRRQQQPTLNSNNSNHNDENKNDKHRNNNLHRIKIKNSQDEDDDILDDDSETGSDDETENVMGNTKNNGRRNHPKENLNGLLLSNSSSPSSNASPISSSNSLFQQQQQIQQLQGFQLFNCESQLPNNIDQVAHGYPNGEIVSYSNNFYTQQKASDCNRLLSLCDFNSNIQSSGPASSSSSTSSIASLSSSSFSSRIQNLAYFETNIHDKDEKNNPIDRLHSMHASYFCSKC